MRDLFSDLIKARVASFEQKPLGPEVPTMDPLVLKYNQYWGAATDTHCSFVQGRYIVTGSFLSKPKWSCEPSPDTLLLYWKNVNGVDVEPSGHSCLYNLLNGLGKMAVHIKYNGDDAMEFVDKEDLPVSSLTNVCCTDLTTCEPVDISSLEKFNGSFSEACNQCSTMSELVGIFNTGLMRGTWHSEGSHIVCEHNGHKYVIEMGVLSKKPSDPDKWWEVVDDFTDGKQIFSILQDLKLSKPETSIAPLNAARAILNYEQYGGELSSMIIPIYNAEYKKWAYNKQYIIPENVWSHLYISFKYNFITVGTDGSKYGSKQGNCVSIPIKDAIEFVNYLIKDKGFDTNRLKKDMQKPESYKNKPDIESETKAWIKKNIKM